MKITRYWQSCLLVEEGTARILVDPSGAEAERFASFGKLDAVLYTHEHSDHFGPDLSQKFADAGVPLYANASTAKQMKSQPNIVTDGQEFTAGSVKVQVRELLHCPMPDGSAGPQNTGYLINQKLFHAGDGKELANLNVEVLAAAMLGPDVSVRDTCDFAKQVGAKIVVPLHYDVFNAKPDFFVNVTGWFSMPFKVQPLELGEGAEI